MEKENSQEKVFTDDMCLIIRAPIEEFGIDRYHQLESDVGQTLARLGFTRIGTDKTETQIYIHYRQFGYCQENPK